MVSWLAGAADARARPRRHGGKPLLAGPVDPYPGAWCRLSVAPGAEDSEAYAQAAAMCLANRAQVSLALATIREGLQDHLHEGTLKHFQAACRVARVEQG